MDVYDWVRIAGKVILALALMGLVLLLDYEHKHYGNISYKINIPEEEKEIDNMFVYSLFCYRREYRWWKALIGRYRDRLKRKEKGETDGQ